MTEQLKEIDRWNNLRGNLNQTYNYNEDWESAILLFENRLTNKFFAPMKKLIEGKELKGEGFSIVTVQCAIIEALAAFREGKIYKYGVNQHPYYNDSKNMFVGFLQSASIFEGNFWQNDGAGGKTLDTPFRALDFYKNVRCGLMHEARTKRGWIINATKKDVRNEIVFLERKGSQVKVLRTVLHYRLIEYLKNYLLELRDQTPAGNNLRKNFARKLDHLFDKAPDPNNFSWWQ